ncbi:Uncharacterised protein [Corynebacterium renale]|nr:Uncharacterised protein [Corynebacterium renale]STC98276.1 Uncharacterised protein [Corynebacterium renale]
MPVSMVFFGCATMGGALMHFPVHFEVTQFWKISSSLRLCGCILFWRAPGLQRAAHI